MCTCLCTAPVAQLPIDVLVFAFTALYPGSREQPLRTGPGLTASHLIDPERMMPDDQFDCVPPQDDLSWR